jgi:hypothetical protein
VVSFTPGRFTPRERVPGTHWIGGWVGPRAGGEEKNSQHLPGLEPKITQPVAQSYTTELSWLLTHPINEYMKVKFKPNLICEITEFMHHYEMVSYYIRVICNNKTKLFHDGCHERYRISNVKAS